MLNNNIVEAFAICQALGERAMFQDCVTNESFWAWEIAKSKPLKKL